MTDLTLTPEQVATVREIGEKTAEAFRELGHDVPDDWIEASTTRLTRPMTLADFGEITVQRADAAE